MNKDDKRYSFGKTVALPFDAAVQRITMEGEGGAVLTMETQGRDGHSRMTVTPVR